MGEILTLGYECQFQAPPALPTVNVEQNNGWADPRDGQNTVERENHHRLNV